MSMDLSFIKNQIDRHYSNAHARLMQLGPAQRLDIEIEGIYFVLESDPDEEGVGFSHVQLGGLDFNEPDELIYLDEEGAFKRVLAKINRALEAPNRAVRARSLPPPEPPRHRDAGGSSPQKPIA